MTPTQKEVYKNKAIKEIKRVAKLFPVFMSQSEYNNNTRVEYTMGKIYSRTGLHYNGIKTLARLPCKIRRRTENSSPYVKKKKPTNTTRRNCNMRDEHHNAKDFFFEAVDDMRSCPKCANIKQNGSYHSGMDV